MYPILFNISINIMSFKLLFSWSIFRIIAGVFQLVIIIMYIYLCLLYIPVCVLEGRKSPKIGIIGAGTVCILPGV